MESYKLVATGAIFLLIVSVLLIINLISRMKHLALDNRTLDSFNKSMKTFMDAHPALAYLKDRDLRYVFTNRALREFLGSTEEELVGKRDSEIMEGLAQICEVLDRKVLAEQKAVTEIIEWDRIFFRTTKFPVILTDGSVGVGAYIRDISEELQYQKMMEKNSEHNRILLEVLSRDFQNKQDQLDYALHELLKLNESEFGYIYLYNEEEQTFILNSWTQGVMEECKIKDYPALYHLEKTGIWGEVVRQRKPIIVNDFEKPNPLKKGYPKGHVELKKFMSVPVFIDGKIVAVGGFGNKQADYDNSDIYEMGVLLSGVWNAVQRREHTREIEYISFHDSLTGLYNRRFFEKELRRLDVERNLPISILIGDINNLKLTNDIFGHQHGDELLKKTSDVMREICRPDDIIARWGGDEFVILLPQTTSEEAAGIIKRIKGKMEGLKVCSMGCSISLAYDTKMKKETNISQTLTNAEVKMYTAKTLEHYEIQDRGLKSIENIFFDRDDSQKQHAENVSRIGSTIGAALKLSETDLQKLAEAGYYHDIGKVVSDSDQHPAIGYRILNHFIKTMKLADIVLAHHEKWDGTGYPDGIDGKKIPLLFRILTVAEVYDRMIHPHTGVGCTKDAAYRKIVDGSGTCFDPDIVETFAGLYLCNRL